MKSKKHTISYKEKQKDKEVKAVIETNLDENMRLLLSERLGEELVLLSR